MKKMPKRLSLCRETLRDLTASALEKAAGGGRSEASLCYTCESCTGACCGPPPE